MVCSEAGDSAGQGENVDGAAVCELWSSEDEDMDDEDDGFSKISDLSPITNDQNQVLLAK